MPVQFCVTNSGVRLLYTLIQLAPLLKKINNEAQGRRQFEEGLAAG